MSTTEKPDATAAWDESKLPNPGPGRFWRLERNAKNQTKPIKISLMQALPGTRSSKFSDVVGYGQAPGIPDLIYEEAQTVLDIHGRVTELLGDYGWKPEVV